MAAPPTMSSTVSARLNADLLEHNYALWKNDAHAVDATWAAFFEGFELGTAQPPRAPGSGITGTTRAAGGAETALLTKVTSAVFAFRGLGHTAVWLDPLSSGPPEQPALTL